MPLVLPDSPSPLQRNKHPAKQMSGASAAWLRPSKPSPPPHALRRIIPSLTTPVASLALFLLATAALFLYSQSAARPYGSIGAAPPLLSPTVESVDGARVIWELPAAGPARAVLFIAHGCRCRPENFWPPSPRCPGCVGLPEDVAITARALERRFAVLAMASAGECWSMGSEVIAAKSVIRSWAARNGLGGLPVAALGASSGGYFVSRLAVKMNLAAVVIMIAEGAFGRSGAALPRNYPPTMFFHMPKDKKRAALVDSNSRILRKNGVEVMELQSLELPLTSTLLSERIHGLDRGLSQRIWNAFKEEGFINENGYMREDGRSTPWKDALVKRGFWKEVSPWADHIQEELNLAYGYHEMTSLHIDEMFDWIEKHLS
ncbi:hypothetical protein PR202_gb04768 [Eleusine coracana subsp. coracana]|uniref:Uncharacterized protein n=1 Tax=Eleusine coracana subsp. coracana TaxID=191504 RepID=A0AAV5E3Q8_ELECO|nr:hypothetical protein QOZ80_1BG0083210 [Eleusine coracana subsp. coracana]GJN17679.1 hypothetical protein PR202_gb04768 [Eleusine coracana subsp. coracana]